MNSRFPFEDIETCAGDGPLAERRDQGRIVKHTAPGCMDKYRRFFS